MGEFVNLEIADTGVATIRIDRPKLNPLSDQVALEIGDVVDAIAIDPQVRAAIVWGGERVFAAGADIKEMATQDPVEMFRYIGRFQDVFTRLERLPVVTIAAINGYALGGGCELALACDLRICAEDSQLGQPEILLGVIPGAGGTQRLPRLVGVGRAKEIIYTGRFVPAEEALRIGLVNEVVAPDKVYAARFGSSGEIGQRSVGGIDGRKADDPERGGRRHDVPGCCSNARHSQPCSRPRIRASG